MLLQIHLTREGILPLITVRASRTPNINLPKEIEMKRRGRGIIEKVAKIDDIQISLISWYDDKVVNLLSTYV